MTQMNDDKVVFKIEQIAKDVLKIDKQKVCINEQTDLYTLPAWEISYALLQVYRARETTSQEEHQLNDCETAQN